MRLTRILRSIFAASPFADVPGVEELLDIVPYLSMEERRRLLKFTRVRAPPTEDPLKSQLGQPNTTPSVIEAVPTMWELPKRSVLHEAVYQIAQSDPYNSVLSQYLRVAPQGTVDPEAIETQAFRDSFVKEFDATQGEDRSHTVDWRVFIYRVHAHKQCHPLIPARYRTQDATASAYSDLRTSLHGRLLYPRYSRRSVSKETAASIGFSRATGIDVERHYCKTGVHATGRMELRQVWGYNDLAPRTYFAMGGTTYRSSKYLQEIFMTLVDTFEVSHRKRRFDLGRLNFDESENIWIYDYSAFTSNMTEQKYFINELAWFFDGVFVRVVDTHYGVQAVSLKDMLLEYNTVCNMGPEFYIGPVACKRLNMISGHYIHKKAGALGIYGNIASCTLGHAHVSSSIAGGPTKTVVVGDDGSVVLPATERYDREPGEDIQLENELAVRSALRVLGDIADTKFAILSGEFGRRYWTFLKRGLERYSDELVHRPQEYILPLTIFLHGAKTLRGKPGRASDEQSLAYEVIMAIWALMIKVERTPRMSDDDVDAVHNILTTVYTYLKLPIGGSLGHTKVRTGTKRWSGSQELGYVEIGWIDLKVSVPPIPTMAKRLRRGPFSLLLDRFDSAVIRRTRVKLIRAGTRLPVTIINTVGFEWETTGTRATGLLRDMGYLIEEEVREEVDMSTEEYVAFLKDVYDRNMRPVIRYRIVRTLPSHFVGLMLMAQ